MFANEGVSLRSLSAGVIETKLFTGIYVRCQAIKGHLVYIV